MNFLLPLTSAIGPAYFALQGLPILWVPVWSAIWTLLRIAVEWQSVWTESQQPGDQPASWLETHPMVNVALWLAAAFFVTLTAFAAMHLSVYWIVRGVVDAAL